MTMSLQKLLVASVIAITFFVTYSQRQLGATEPAVKEPNKSVKPTAEMEQTARLIVANELMRLHWTRWVTGKQLREIADEAAQEINDQLENRMEVEFLLPDEKGKRRKLDAFEEQAVEDIRAGVEEAWHEDSEGTQYVRGIRATKTCIHCHQPLGSPNAELSEGDLLGIISLKLK